MVPARGERPGGAPHAPAELLERLRANRLHVTAVRSAMLAALARLTSPVTLRELQGAIDAPTPVAFASLYRCMLRFEQIALVRRLIGFDGTVRWELSPGRPEDFRVTCRQTGQVAPLDRDSTDELRRVMEKIEQRLRADGFTELRFNVAFHGVSHAAAAAGASPA